MADVFVINKTDSAPAADVQLAEEGLRAINSRAVVVRAASPIRLDDAAAVKGKRVLVVEDGPTITHGGMAYGAGYLGAVATGAVVVDPRPWLAPLLRQMFEAYPHIGKVLPAIGYDADQLSALRSTINDADVDLVICGTPIDLARVVKLNKQVVRVRYEFAELGEPRLSSIIDGFVARKLGDARRH
jgi:predicted GTPase